MLGEVFTEPARFAAVRPLVADSDFFEDRNRALFSALESLADAGQPIAPDTVLAELRRRGDLERSGGVARIAEIADMVPVASPPALAYHAKNVRRCALERKRSALARQASAGEADDGVLWSALVEVQREIESMEVQAERFRFLTDTDLSDLPAPEYLIDGILPAGSLAMLWGHPETGKSFVAVDWSLCVATGSPWMNRPVTRGGVVYIVSEGALGMNKRVRAWKKHRHFWGDTGALFLPDRIRLTDAAEASAFIASLKQLPAPPVLVVIDTLARAMAGADENSTQEAGAAIENADRIRKETGAAVLLLHHPNKQGQEPRGNTSFVGALDTSICLRKLEKRIILDCRKQKDSAPFDPIPLRLMPFGESCVMVDPARARAEWAESGGGLTEQERQALETLARHFIREDGALLSQWLRASGIPDSSFYRVRTSLYEQGYVRKASAKHNAHYVLTTLGVSVTLSSQDTLKVLSHNSQKLLSNGGTPIEGPRESIGVSDGVDDAA